MKVLVVDTDPKSVHELGAAVRRSGCEPLEATTFQAAKRLWIAEHPSGLIADIQLGQFNGLQLLLRAKADRPDVAAVITSPVADKVLEAETQRFGATFLVKPVAPDEVVAAVFRSLPTSSLSGDGQPMFSGDGQPAFSGDGQPVFSGDGQPVRLVTKERRMDERRQVITSGYRPDRRLSDRRRAGPS